MSRKEDSEKKQVVPVHPPRWAERLLSWYCKPALLEDLQGDLNEYFDRNLEAKGVRRARFIYCLDVLKFFRLYTIRKPKFISILIHWLMLGNYFKTSGRNLVRNKLFSTINIFGLAVSMSVGLLMIAVLNDILSYDKFNMHHDRIFRVVCKMESSGFKSANYFATTSIRAGQAIQTSLPTAENVAIIHNDFTGDVLLDEKGIPLEGFWANADFFNVFSYKLIEGNPNTALQDPFGMVLTESSARKLFGNSDALGKTVMFRDHPYTITGVMEDLPQFSHMKFEMLGSLKTREITEKENDSELAWDNIWSTWVYVLLPANPNLTTFQQGLDQLSVQEEASLKDLHVQLALQPLDDIMTGEKMSNSIGPIMGKTQIWIFSALAFVVILSACFNYTNLSIARSITRTREVGIRKAIGALKSHVIGQFVIESTLISFLSLVMAFGLFFLFRPYFLDLHPELSQMLILALSPRVLFFFVGFALLVGIAAGFYPALFFSRINPAVVLKSLSTVPLFQKINLRKVLIVFQYTISILFITFSVIIFKQYKHFVSFDLGFNTENVLNIDLQGNPSDVLKNELTQLPEVQEISQSMMITSLGEYYGANLKNPENPTDSATIYYNLIDENYIPLHNHELLAGGNFTPKADSATETEIIVNQQILKRFDIADQKPENAIGHVVTLNGKELRIVGVLKDFQYGQANNATAQEMAFRYSAHPKRYLNLKILSTDWPATYTKIENIWKAADPVHPMQAKFYDEALEESFVGLLASFKLAGFLSGLAICIASLGLLGMVVFTTETRMKEISIRKVLGAGEGNLMYLLGKSFYALLALSTCIALPTVYLVFQQLLLPDMANSAPIGVLEMFSGVLAILLIASLIVGSQTLRAARTNPAEVLKNE